jgi:hypothetical protein
MRKTLWTLRFSSVVLLVFSLFFALIFLFALFCDVWQFHLLPKYVPVTGLRRSVELGLSFWEIYFEIRSQNSIWCNFIVQRNVFLSSANLPWNHEAKYRTFYFTYVSLGSLLDFSEFSLKSNGKMAVYSGFTPYIFCVISCSFFLCYCHRAFVC